MRGRFLDGRSARPREVGVEIADGRLVVANGDTTHAWSMKTLDVVVEGDQARLSHPSDRDARLVMAASDWRELSRDHAPTLVRRSRRREAWLVGGLVAFALATVLFVFVGVPILSGPLARATPPALERRMGRNFDVQMNAIFRPCKGQEGQAVLARLGDRVAAGADTPFDVRVRAVQAPMLNAFALPGGAILVTDDLIRDAENPDELSAVIAHEVSHVEKRHVMQAVWRSLGIGMVLDAVVGGGSGAGQQAVILAGQATDLSYGRGAEAEADARGQALLNAQGLSSKGMASFFARLGGDGEGDLDRVAEFASDHPNSARRARAARAAEQPGAAALTPAEWAAVKAACPAGEGALDSVRRRLGLENTAEGDESAPKP